MYSFAPLKKTKNGYLKKYATCMIYVLLSSTMDFYSEHEISQLLLAVNGTSLEALIQIAITTGMRQSEILALKWSDLEWDRNTITVQRQLRRKHEDHNHFSSLKTSAGRRTISLGLDTILKLREHYKKQLSEKSKKGGQWEENDPIFPSSIGKVRLP